MGISYSRQEEHQQGEENGNSLNQITGNTRSRTNNEGSANLPSTTGEQQREDDVGNMTMDFTHEIEFGSSGSLFFPGNEHGNHNNNNSNSPHSSQSSIGPSRIRRQNRTQYTPYATSSTSASSINHNSGGNNTSNSHSQNEPSLSIVTNNSNNSNNGIFGRRNNNNNANERSATNPFDRLWRMASRRQHNTSNSDSRQARMDSTRQQQDQHRMETANINNNASTSSSSIGNNNTRQEGMSTGNAVPLNGETIIIFGVRSNEPEVTASSNTTNASMTTTLNNATETSSSITQSQRNDTSSMNPPIPTINEDTGVGSTNINNTMNNNDNSTTTPTSTTTTTTDNTTINGSRGRRVAQRWMVYLIAGNNPNALRNLQELGLDLAAQNGNTNTGTNINTNQTGTASSTSPPLGSQEQQMATERSASFSENGRFSLRNRFGEILADVRPESEPRNTTGATPSPPPLVTADDDPSMNATQATNNGSSNGPQITFGANPASILLATMMTTMLGIRSTNAGSSGEGGADYDALVRLAEILGPARPRHARKKDVQEQLPVVKFKHGIIGVHKSCLEKCCICLNQYEEEEELRVLTCKHAFHKDCIDEWLLRYVNTCPMCRNEAVKSSNSGTPNSSSSDPNTSSSSNQRQETRNEANNETSNSTSSNSIPIGSNSTTSNIDSMDSAPNSIIETQQRATSSGDANTSSHQPMNQSNIQNNNDASASDNDETRNIRRFSAARRPDLISQLIYEAIQAREDVRREAINRGDVDTRAHDTFMIILN